MLAEGDPDACALTFVDTAKHKIPATVNLLLMQIVTWLIC